MQLVLLEDSFAQSGVGVCRELLTRSLERSCPVILVCLQHDPNLFGRINNAHNICILDHHYDSVAHGMSLARVEREILAAIDKRMYEWHQHLPKYLNTHVRLYLSTRLMR